MAGKKQVMDMRSTTSGVSSQESDEQQRNWTKQHWEKKAKDSLSNYDPTRAKLNFEVVKGGIIQPIDTSKTIAEKMAENLAARGIKDPNARPNAVMKRRTVAQFIFGGNRERMHEIAFGNQTVDLTKGADNSSIVRCKDIEEWAKDVYSFMAKRFGEDNIISFYVHLDEKNPHCHCTLVPVDPVKNRISWKSVFGDGREAESANMTKLHSELQEAVSEKWGLERGSNMEETRARHRSTEEYKRELVSEVCNLQSTREDLLKQIHRAEIKLKGISTMIANLQARKDDIQTQDVKDRAVDALDEVANVEDITNPPMDSIRKYVPSVSLPLKHIQVNSPFGVRKDPMNKRTKRIHNGLDLKAKFEEVYSMLPGVVTAASYSTNGGYYVTINHGICVCSYLHLSKILVRTGQRVTAGYIIAISGNSGKRTTGPHLHISCRWKNERGKFFNPMLILRFVTEQLLNKE